MKTNYLKTTFGVIALMVAILFTSQLTASGLDRHDSSTDSGESSVPFNALGQVSSNGGIQVFVNKVYPFMLDGTPVQFVQIYHVNGVFVFVRRGVTANDGRRTEFVALDVSNGFLLYNPKWFRTCFSPDCGGEVTSEPGGSNGQDILVGGGIGFCTPNTSGNACNCAGGYDCTFGMSGGAVGIDDVVIW